VINKTVNRAELNIAAVEEKAWNVLLSCNPDEVCRRASVRFDKDLKGYIVRSYGIDFTVSLNEKKISCGSFHGDALLNAVGCFFRSSLLWYLIHAKDACLSGKLVKPENLKGGQLFARGTHVLPLDKVAEKYAADKAGYLKKGIAFGGEATNYGDAALRIEPFPRLPMTLILWLEDEEFPARAELMADSSCTMHLPIDVIWSIAMTTVLLFSEGQGWCTDPVCRSSPDNSAVDNITH
jgi:hypothetical protein